MTRRTMGIKRLPQQHESTSGQQLSTLYIEMDNEQAHLEVLETRLNIVRKFLIMISDIKLLRLGVSGASIQGCR